MTNNNPPICLKIRGGVEVDSKGNKAGKGPLLSENLSMTLGTSQDQYLFQPIVRDPVGGQAERAWQTDVSPTLKATHYKFPPSIMVSGGFKPGQGAKAQGIGWEMEKSPTLLAGQEPGVCYSIEPVAYGVVTKGNGDAFLNDKTHTSLSVGGGQAGQGYPCVLQAFGLDTYNQAVEKEVAQPLRASLGGDSLPKVCCAYSVENHPNDSRYRIDDSGIVQTLMGRMGTGGGNEQIVMLEQKVRILNPHDSQGNHVASSNGIYPTLRGCGGAGYQQGYVLAPVVFDARGNGDGKITATITGVHEHSISDYTNVIVLRLDNGSAYPVVCGDKSPTIRRGNGPGGTGHVAVCFQQNQRDEVRIMEKPGAITAQPWMKCQNFIAEHAVCYGISSMDSNAMRSSNPHSGIYEAKTSRTLDLNGGNPACNQGGIIICQRKTDVVYPEKTGPLMANSHPGSYCGQDAYQDMFVVERRG